MEKRALITGISGQDGSYLAELLLSKDYQVYGMVRQADYSKYKNIAHLLNHPKLTLVNGDMNDVHSLISVLEHGFDEVYNLAAQSFVGNSWNTPDYTLRTNGVAVENLLRAIRTTHRSSSYPKVYQASTSEMYGNLPGETLIDLDTKFRPCSPYGVAKLAAHHTAINYRETHGMFVCCGILFNHESPRRGAEFVTQKIATGLARLKVNYDKDNKVKLGNILSKRDWGYAPEYVYAMWYMMQNSYPADYIIGTGVATSVKQFAIYCMEALSLPVEDFDAYITRNWLAHSRPKDLNCLIADPNPTKKTLMWQAKTTVQKLAVIMCAEAYTTITGEQL